LSKKQVQKIQDLPEDFLKKLKSVTAKRAKIVIDHILEHGHVTTEELKDIYGYDHPPRAVRDVKEHGIPIIRFSVKGKNNRNIAAYRLGDSLQTQSGILDRRIHFSKQTKNELLELYQSQCVICSTKFESRYLQIDHRIPFDIAGETENSLQLLCGSCNRAKSWSCEHCANRTNGKDTEVCRCCYWANPVQYTHIALRLIRRLDITWTEQETVYYDKIKKMSEQNNRPLPDFIKDFIRTALSKFFH
jgi:hypothetical protein